MESVINIIEDAIDRFEYALNKLPKVNASKIGLDPRAGYVYVDSENEMIIADHRNVQSLEYYGGFEYIDNDTTITIGEYKVFTSASVRVSDAIDAFLESQGGVE